MYDLQIIKKIFLFYFMEINKAKKIIFIFIFIYLFIKKKVLYIPKLFIHLKM